MKSIRSCVRGLVLALAAAGGVAGCESVPGSYDGSVPLEAIRGTWAGEADGDAQRRLRFGTAEGDWHGARIIVSASGVEVERFRYAFRPIPDRTGGYALDLFAFEDEGEDDRRERGLLEWVEPGESFRLVLGRGGRPRSLAPSAEVFRRVDPAP